MKKNKLFKMAISLFSAILLLNSCVKDGEDLVGNSGSSLVKFLPGDFNLLAINASNVSQSGALFDVRRDVNSESALNAPATVTLKFDVSGSMLAAYNEKLVEDWMAADPENTDPADYDGPVFEALPVSYYTTDPAPAADGTITVNFAAGEFAKSVNITIPDATKFDFSAFYGIAYQLVSVSGEGVKSLNASDVIVCQVLAKNKYDGKYEVTANSPMVDVVVPTLTGWYPFTYELQTTGANTVACYLTDPGYYNYYHPITSAGAVSVYGAFGLAIEFDPATNKIKAVTNPWGNPPANTRMPAIDPSGVNMFDPATRNIKFKYWMKQPSLVPAAPNIRNYFDETWTYKGPR